MISSQPARATAPSGKEFTQIASRAKLTSEETETDGRPGVERHDRKEPDEAEGDDADQSQTNDALGKRAIRRHLGRDRLGSSIC